MHSPTPQDQQAGVLPFIQGLLLLHHAGDAVGQLHRLVLPGLVGLHPPAVGEKEGHRPGDDQQEDGGPHAPGQVLRDAVAPLVVGQAPQQNQHRGGEDAQGHPQGQAPRLDPDGGQVVVDHFQGEGADGQGRVLRGLQGRGQLPGEGVGQVDLIFQ